MTREKFRKRLLWMSALTALLFLTVPARLFYLQVIAHDMLQEQEYALTVRKVREVEPRGRIFDRNGIILVDNVVRRDAVINKKVMHDLLPAEERVEYVSKDRKLRRLCAPQECEKISSAKFDRNIGIILNTFADNGLPIDKTTAAKMREAAPNYFRFYKDIDAFQYEKLRKLEVINGFEFELKQSRDYPQGGLLRDVLGRPHEDSADSFGLEALYDNYLRGAVTERCYLRGSRGRRYFADSDVCNRDEGEGGDASTAPYKAKDIYLTIDSDLQELAESSLRETVEETKAQQGIALVQNVNTGELIAMATYDPKWKSGDLIKPIGWTYDPGSTFKAITLAAGLESGIINETDTFDLENGRWKINGRSRDDVVDDHKMKGKHTVVDIIAESSNIGTAKMAQRIYEKDSKYLYTKWLEFGFGKKSGLGFNGDVPGMFRPLKEYENIVNLSRASYGQGITVTPVQLITVYSALVNGGRLYEPKLIIKATEKDGAVYREFKPELQNPYHPPISPETSARVKKILLEAVENGTGKLTASIPGYKIGGKTGTSRKVSSAGGYTKNNNFASFCGFLPYDNPHYAVLVIIDDPRKTGYTTGAMAAGPVFKALASRLINMEGYPPDNIQTDLKPAAGTAPAVKSVPVSAPVAAAAKGNLTGGQEPPAVVKTKIDMDMSMKVER